MKGTFQKPFGVKVTFYTHPFCETSRDMLSELIRFYNEFNGLITFRLCLGESFLNDETVSNGKSYEMCLAVKAASLQSEISALLYLNEVCLVLHQEGVKLLNTAELIRIARQVGHKYGGQFDFNRFCDDLTSKQARQVYNQDLLKFHINRISCTPAITFTCEGKGMKLQGKKSYQQLVRVLNQFLSSLVDNPQAEAALRNQC